MSKTRSNKTKGKNGQNEIRDLILKYFPDLEPDDVISNPMGNTGADIFLSPKARSYLPYDIEVKRKKAFSMVRHMEQAKGHGSHEPIVFFREDRGKWHATMEAEHFFNLIREKL